VVVALARIMVDTLLEPLIFQAASHRALFLSWKFIHRNSRLITVPDSAALIVVPPNWKAFVDQPSCTAFCTMRVMIVTEISVYM